MEHRPDLLAADRASRSCGTPTRTTTRPTRSARRARRTTPQNPPGHLPAAVPRARHRRGRTARRGEVRLRPGATPTRRSSPSTTTRPSSSASSPATTCGRSGWTRRATSSRSTTCSTAGPRRPRPSRPFLCDNPMDMMWGDDGNFYLLTYGDGFFNVNPDAALVKFSYVKGLRAPIAVLGATPTNGIAPLTVAFSSDGSRDPDPADSITLRVGPRRQRDGRLGRAQPDVHLHRQRRLHGPPDGHRLQRQDGVGEHDDHGRQHLSDGERHRAGRGRVVRLRRQHPVLGHRQRPRGRADRLLAGRGDLRPRSRHARPRRGDRQPVAPARCRPRPGTSPTAATSSASSARPTPTSVGRPACRP